MYCDYHIDEVVHRLSRLDRAACKQYLRSFHEPDLDFSDEYLDGLSVEGLRHLIYVACEQVRVSDR